MNEIGIKITGDASGGKKALEEMSAAEKAFRDTSQEASKQAAAKRQAEQAAANRQAEQFVATVRRQAETLGMTRGQLLQYDAATKGLSATQQEEVRAAAATIDAYSIKEKVLQRLKLTAAGAGAVITATLVASMRASVNAAIEAERSIARLNAVWSASGGTSGLSRAQQSGLVEGLERTTGSSGEEIRAAMTELSLFRTVAGDAFIDTMKLAGGLAEVLGTDLRSAVQQLGRALEDPVQGLGALRRAGIIFSDAQQEVIKNLVETGRRSEAVQIILRDLKSRGLDVVADAARQGMGRAMSDAGKGWDQLLESLGKTTAVQAPVTGFFGSLAEYLKRVKAVVEDGTWLERLAFFSVGYSSKRIEDMLGAPGGAGADDTAEGAMARRNAQQARWQADYDAYQAGLTKFIEEREKKIKEKAAEDAQVAAGQGAAAQAIQEIMDEASALGVKFLQEQQKKTEALKEEGDAVRDLINPWNAYGREVERLRALMEKGAITHSEFVAAVGLAANKSAGDLQELSKAGEDTFGDMKAAVDDFGRELSRSFAKGEGGFRNMIDLAGKFGEELLAIQIQKRIMDPLLKSGTSFLDGLFNNTGVASSSQMAEFQAAGAYTGNAAPFHTGGIVGLEGGARRYVHPAYFERAPRLHSGGLAGGEVPAILKRGEGVFTPEQMRAMGGTGKVTVNLINQSGQQLEAKASPVRFDASGAVVDLFLRGLSTNAGAREQLGGMLKGPTNY